MQKLLVALLFLLAATLADPTITNVVGRYRVRAWSKRPVSGIKYIVVHHTAMTGGGSDDAVLRALMNVHVNSNGWAGLSYHYAILKNGNIYQVNSHDDRTNTDTVNVDSVAIVLHGYFHPNVNEQITAAQIASLEFLLNRLMTTFGLTKSAILGHRERVATACPGDTVFPRVRNYRINGVPGTPGTPNPTPIANRLPAGRGCIQVEVNLRNNGRLRGNVITVLPQGTTVQILATTPVNEDGYNWYEVTSGNNRGWVAEGTSTKTYLTSCPDNVAATALPGSRVVTTGSEICFTDAANQRDAPCGNIITTQPVGTKGVVVDDPQNGADSCGYLWYKVKVGTSVGWMAQGPWFGFCAGNAVFDPEGNDISDLNSITPEELDAMKAEAGAAEDAPSTPSSASVITFSAAILAAIALLL